MADLAFVALPWIIMWDSQMRRAKKIGVAVGMSLGFVYASLNMSMSVAVDSAELT